MNSLCIIIVMLMLKLNEMIVGVSALLCSRCWTLFIQLYVIDFPIITLKKVPDTEGDERNSPCVLFVLFETVSICFRRFQSIKSVPDYQSESDRFRLFQRVLDYFRLFQTVSGCFRMFQSVVKCSDGAAQTQSLVWLV